MVAPRQATPEGDRRAGVRALDAGDHPHPGRPARQSEQPGQLGYPRPVADLALGVQRAGDPVCAGIFASRSAACSGSPNPTEATASTAR